jgi:uncharacterized protein YceK
MYPQHYIQSLAYHTLLTLPSSDDDTNNVTLKTSAGAQLPAKTTWTLLLYLTSAADGWCVSPLNVCNIPIHAVPDTFWCPASAAKQSSTHTTGAQPRRRSP